MTRNAKNIILSMETVLLFLFSLLAVVVVVVFDTFLPQRQRTAYNYYPISSVDILCYIRRCRIHERVQNTKYTSQPMGTQANFVSDTVCKRECVMAGVNSRIKKKREERKENGPIIWFRWFVIVVR